MEMAGVPELGDLAVDVVKDETAKEKERKEEAKERARTKESQRTKEKAHTKERLDKTNAPFAMAMDTGAVIAHKSLDQWKLTKFKNNLNNSNGLAILLHHHMVHIKVKVLNIQDYQYNNYQ